MLLGIWTLIAIGATAGAGGNRIIYNTLATARTEVDEAGGFTVSTRRKLAVGAVLLGLGLLSCVTAAALAAV